MPKELEIGDLTPIEPPDPPKAPDSQINLAGNYSKEKLAKLGKRVVEDYKEDLSSRSEWEKRKARNLKLFACYRDPKDTPFPNASNICVPLLSMAVLQFQARAYDALVPAKEVVKGWSTDGKAKDAANRITKHMNYQLLTEMEEWEEEMDRLCLLAPLNGVVYKKSYYDPIKRRPVSETLTTDEMVTPYGYKRFEDCPRKTHVIRMSVNDILIREKSKIFVNVDKLKTVKKDGKKVIAPGRDLDSNPLAPQLKDAKDQIDGINESGLLPDDKPRTFLECHRLWDLDKNGIQVACITTVDEETEAVLRIVDRRYKDELTGQEKIYEYFTKYGFIPNPESHLDYGFAHFLERLNETANTIINELVDAGNLQNMQGGFVNTRSGIKKGGLTFARGEYKGVNIPTDDIRKALFPITHNPPSQALFVLLGLIMDYSKEITSVTDAILGKMPPSDTPATSFMATLEQGLKVYSTIHKRMHRSLKKELKKIFTLNSRYLDDKIYFLVQDSTSQEAESLISGRLDYQNHIDVIPVSDPGITSRIEKIAKAEKIYQMTLASPLTNQNQEFIYEATKRVYQQMEVGNIESLLPKPEPQEPPDLPPQEENANFLREKGAVALPQQDHLGHLDAHDAFANSRYSEQLTAQGKKLLEAHNRDHWAMAYLAEQQMQAQIAQQLLQGGGLGGGLQPGAPGGGMGY